MATSKNNMTKEQRELLIARYPTTRTKELADKLGVGYWTVSRWALKLGLKKSKDFKSRMSLLAAQRYKNRYPDASRGKRYSMLDDEKETFMRKHFSNTPDADLAHELGVNDRTIRRWASKLGLKKDKEWANMCRSCNRAHTPEQRFQIVEIIRELFPDGHDKEIMERTGYSRQHICNIARKYGISRSATYDPRWQCGRKKKYSDELVSVIAEYFPTHTDKECAEHFGLDKRVIQNLARYYKWNKNEEHMRKMYASNIAAAIAHNKKRYNRKKQSV